MPDIFARKEVKHIITFDTKDKFLEILKDDIIPEKFHEYRINNIYYDTDDYILFHKSLMKPEYKEKLRLRWYSDISSEIPFSQSDKNGNAFLEIKKKYDGIVYKRRIDDTLGNLMEYTPASDQKAKNRINQEEINYLLERYPLKPKVYLRYDREAWLWKTDPSLRFTFDYNLLYALMDDDPDKLKDIISQDKIVLEIKVAGNLPLKFARAMSELEIRSSSFSKIGKVYKEHIIGGKK